MSKSSKFNIKTLTEKFLQDWSIKIICLGVAFIILLFYRRSTLGRRFFSANISIESSSELVAASSYPGSVKVTLWGDALSISSIREDDIEVYLDLRPYTKPGTFKVPVRNRITGSALNVEPLDIKTEPSAIELRLEESAAKRVPVDLVLKGSVAHSFEISETTVDPATVEIRGPRSIIEKIESMPTEPILLENRNTSFSGRTNLVNTTSLLNIVGTGKTDYWVKIVEKIIGKDFSNVPVQVVNLKPELVLSSELAPVSISISGKQNIVEAFQPTSQFLRLDCAEITEPGEYNLKVLVATSEGVQITSVFPDTIAVSIDLNEELLTTDDETTEPDVTPDDSELLE